MTLAHRAVHITPDGPGPCWATERTCKYEADGHYPNYQDADVAFEAKMGGAVPEVANREQPAGKKMLNALRSMVGGRRAPAESTAPSEPKVARLELDFDTVAVKDGDLSNRLTRHYLVNGLCGDLAMAIHDKQGGRVFFAVDEHLPLGVTLEDAAEKGELGSHVTHAFVESKEHPGKFIDAYGVKSAEEIQNYYGTDIQEVSPELLSHFGSGPGGARGNHDLSGFADAAIELDREGRTYEYEGEDYGGKSFD